MLRVSGRAVITFPNEADGHGITSFADAESLVALFRQHGLRADVRVLRITGWAEAVHLAFWRRPLHAFRKRRRTYDDQSDHPQVMHETWYYHAARTPRRYYLLVNLYARAVERIMRSAGPIYRAYVVNSGADIVNQRVLVRAWKDGTHTVQSPA